MQIARTERFKRAWRHLTREEKVSARKAIGNLAADMSYPALRVKKIRGTDSIWEARASHSLRMTFQVEGDTAILRNIGYHDETLTRP